MLFKCLHPEREEEKSSKTPSRMKRRIKSDQRFSGSQRGQHLCKTDERLEMSQLLHSGTAHDGLKENGPKGSGTISCGLVGGTVPPWRLALRSHICSSHAQ